MTKDSQPLAAFARNITSQNGEDGLLEEILRRIGDGSRWCLEVGAWDGEHFSNTCTLWRDRDWSAVLIECSDKLFPQLKDKTRAHPKVHPLHRRVMSSGQNSLAALLEEVKAPRSIDVVSIDVDGNDYFLFESLDAFMPRVVIIEHNPTIPPEVDLVQTPDSSARFGASAGALAGLARKKGYGLAACTLCNCIFVRETEFARLGYAPLEIEKVFCRDQLVYLMNTYNGKAFINRAPIYTDLRRSWSAWMRNFLFPSKRAVWPTKAIPVICQRATPGPQ